MRGRMEGDAVIAPAWCLAAGGGRLRKSRYMKSPHALYLYGVSQTQAHCSHIQALPQERAPPFLKYKISLSQYTKVSAENSLS